ANHLPYLLAGAVRRAWETRQPARLGHASGRTDIGINRRERLADGRLIIGENPAGLCDQEVGVLRVDTIEGVPLVTVVNAVCHPVILGPQSLAVSADFVGQTRRAVEAVTGVPLLFLQGACGDINPRGGVQADDANCRRLGITLAGEVLRVHAGIICDSDAETLATRRMEVAMPLRPLPESLRTPSPAKSAAMLDLRFPWSATVTNDMIALEVQALQVGDLGIVSLACEPFTATGLACKAASPFARTFVAGYTNGNIGYVPTADAFPLGGYEVTTAHHYYRLPYPVASEAEALLSRTAQAALGSVSA
ncbi:MAG: hypothetical protein ACTHMJ_04610, partial [Thermomicrobiales bacterium]